ncbi:ribosomal protein L19 [Pycnococcus provasolii]
MGGAWRGVLSSSHLSSLGSSMMSSSTSHAPAPGVLSLASTSQDASIQASSYQPTHPSRLRYPASPAFTPTRLMPRSRNLKVRTERMLKTIDDEYQNRMQTERPLPDFRTGDIVEVHVLTPENRNRVQIFRGMCISRRNRRSGSTFNVRGSVGGVNVERSFPLYSPTVRDVKVVGRKQSKSRPDSKMWYLWHKTDTRGKKR